MSSLRTDRVLFARIGWMTFYRGISPGDSELVGGGAYNKTHTGSEVLNFVPHQSRMFGFVQGVGEHSLSLERIDPVARHHDLVRSTLVIFVSRRPHQTGQVIVGWYRDATVHRGTDADPRPQFRKARLFNVTVAQKSAVLLPTRQRWEEVQGGKGGFGQTNVCYSRLPGGNFKNAAWIRKAIGYVTSYAGPNLVTHPEAEVEDEASARAEAVHAAGQGQGFASTPAERRAIEDHAMSRAMAYFKKRYAVVENISKQKGVLDLRCGTAGRTHVHVEVKGTTTTGESVILTQGEVNRARQGNAALYVLHSIRLEHGRATGGKERVVERWDIEKGRLTPMNFAYRLP